VATTLSNLALFYLQCKKDKTLSLKYIDEFLPIWIEFNYIPRVQKYGIKIIWVLGQWGINVEEYIENYFCKQQKED
jgi:hypothetical protein